MAPEPDCHTEKLTVTTLPTTPEIPTIVLASIIKSDQKSKNYESLKWNMQEKH